MGTGYLIAVAVVAIAVLLVLVMKARIPAFVALLLVAIATALAAGIPPEEVVPLVIDGMGSTLGTVALLVGLGAMLGAIVERTGGAVVLADALAARLGPARVGPALIVASGVVALPIFFDVAFIILIPIIFSFARASGHHSPIAIGIPVAGLMVFLHATAPPHPGVTGGATLLGADIGLLTLLALGLAVPMGVLAHFVGKLITRPRFELDPQVQQSYDDPEVESPGGARGPGGDRDERGRRGSEERGQTVLDEPTTVRTDNSDPDPRPTSQPSPMAVVVMVLIPVLLIAAGTIGELLLPEGSTPAAVVSLVGAPAFALLISVVLALFVLGIRHGWTRTEMGQVMDASLAPAAVVVFVTGAGGVFAAVLSETGLGDSISGSMVELGVPIVLLAFLLATVFRVAQGSATVATLATAGLLQSTVAAGDHSSLQVALVVLAIGCGSLALSHINDSGFWIVTRFLGLSVADGLRTWTVMVTALAWSAFLLVCLLWFVVS